MGAEQQNFSVDAAASLLGWWRDAGVDVVIDELPNDRLGAQALVKISPPPSESALAPPQSLGALTTLVMTGDLPDAGPPRRRLGPTGNPTASLMILVDFPDTADVDTGMLLSDAVFDKMLASLGHTRDTVYLAPLCPGRPITSRLSADSVAVLATHALQHIALIAPKQLWLIGTAASRAILGIGDAEARGKLHIVNHHGIMIDTIATAHPRMFGKQPGMKAAAWIEMQRLMTRTDA